MDIQIKRRFQEKDLSDVKTLVDEAEKIASGITVGETLFMKKHGVKSEGEYKRKMMEQGKLMKHSVIGWNSWEATRQGFETVYNELEAAGSFVDRFGACLDWVMGVPAQDRHKFQAGGGLIFKHEDEWKSLGQVVPVQPHLGDHMIGSLNSVENTVNGLKAGVTTIGNLAHYSTYEYPGFDMECRRTEDAVQALAIMAHFRDDGMIVHSNLDDGYGAQFHDLANLVGWARLERYIAEDLLGARLGHCYGNLFSDSMLRVVFNRAMSKINRFGTPGTFVNGNTIDYGTNIPSNYGALCAYSLADIACQVKYPSGYALAPVPLTEAIRVPTAQEIVEGHHTIDRMIEKSKYYVDFIHWDKVNSEADVLVEHGNIFFERVLNALDDLKVDINHPGEVMSVLKAIGAEQLEINFGAGKADETAMRGRVPVRPTSIIRTIGEMQDEVIKNQVYSEQHPLKGINIVLGSTDVHEFGKEVIKKVLTQAGAKVFDLGTTVSIGEIADTMIETESAVVAVSTYNGIAYSFGRDLLASLEQAGLSNTFVVMGGRLNEPMEGSDLPVDVTEELTALGINADNDAEKIVDVIAAFAKKK